MGNGRHGIWRVKLLIELRVLLCLWSEFCWLHFIFEWWKRSQSKKKIKGRGERKRKDPLWNVLCIHRKKLLSVQEIHKDLLLPQCSPFCIEGRTHLTKWKSLQYRFIYRQIVYLPELSRLPQTSSNRQWEKKRINTDSCMNLWKWPFLPTVEKSIQSLRCDDAHKISLRSSTMSLRGHVFI